MEKLDDEEIGEPLIKKEYRKSLNLQYDKGNYEIQEEEETKAERDRSKSNIFSAE